jgi:hypothetical protein
METLRLINGTRLTKHSCDYGEHFVYDSSPEPNGLPYEVLDYIAPNNNLPKIPYLLWLKAVKFFYDYSKQSKEVHVRFWYNPSTCKWLCTVPKQEVTAVSVDFDFSTNICIESGRVLAIPSKEMTQYVLLWQVHSHHSMSPTPSTVDDEGNGHKDGELYRPGGYGIVGSMRGATYAVNFTVVSLADDTAKYKNKRYEIPVENVISTYNKKQVQQQNNSVYDVQYSSEVKRVVINKVRPNPKYYNIPTAVRSNTSYQTLIGSGKYYQAEIPDIVEQLNPKKILEELVSKHGEYKIKSLLSEVGDVHE